MFFQNDWIMRQIEMITAFISKTLFGKDKGDYQVVDFENLTETDMIYRRLSELLSNGDICGAEDFLFDNINTDDDNYLAMGIDFYNKINKLSEDELESKDFSREEIYDGLKSFIDRFGVEVPF